jgi:hypothetical protein
LKQILPSSGLLRGVRWFETDVSGIPVGHTFTRKLSYGLKPAFRRVTTQKTEEFDVLFENKNIKLRNRQHF